MNILSKTLVKLHSQRLKILYEKLRQETLGWKALTKLVSPILEEEMIV